MLPAENAIIIDKEYTICECIFSGVKSICYKVMDENGKYYILKELFSTEVGFFSQKRNQYNCPVVAEEYEKYIDDYHNKKMVSDESNLFDEFYADDEVENNEPYAFGTRLLNATSDNNTKARYLLIDTVRGCDMNDYRRKIRQGADFLKKLVEIMISACSALKSVHNRRILHLDIKPSNLYVVDLEEHPFVKILDFGSSIKMDNEISDDELMKMGKITTSYGYQSPNIKKIEEMRNCSCDISEIRVAAKSLNAKDDIFSLIMTFAYMLIGTTCSDIDVFISYYNDNNLNSVYLGFISEIVKKGLREKYDTVAAVKLDFERLYDIINGKGYHPEVLKRMVRKRIDSLEINDRFINNLYIKEI